MNDIAPARLRVERREFLIVAVWVPAVVAALAVVLMLLWLPRLPAPVATHWSGSGGPDGFGSPWLNIGMLVVISAVFTTVMAFAVLRALARGAAPAVIRLNAVFSPVFTVFLSVVTAGTLGIQVDLADAHDTVGAGWVLVAGVVAAVLTGVICWLILPSRGSDAAPPTPEPATRLASGENASWTRRISTPRWFIAVPIGVGVIAVIPVLIEPALWWASAIILLVVALLGMTMTARVTVDARGLTVRSPLGIRMLHVRLADVASAAVVDVDALAEFGGWGIRIDARGRRGVVLASGQAIQVERRAGAPLVVTVDDAHTGAALLNGLAAR
jgi:hypothetical protein